MMNFPEGHKLRQDLKKFIRSLVFIVGIYVFNISNAAAALTANNDIYGIPMNVISTPNTLTVETLGVLANDAENGNNLPDPPGVLTAVLVSGVSSGTLTCSTNAALQLCPDGSFNYRPDVATFQGVDSFTYNLVNSSTSETSPVPATVTLTACNTTGTVTTCWHETPYLEMLATLGYNMFRESFEGSIWNTVRSPNAAASVTSKNISWTTNHTATNVLTTSVDVARSGSWGVYDQDHGFSDGTPGVCDVNNPPANCFPYDGFTGSGTSLNAVGGYISGNAAGNISILLDGIQTDIGKSPSAGHQFFGIIDTAGFSTFQFREMDGKIGQTFSIFGDDFVIGTTAQTDTNIAPVLTAIGNQTVNEGVSFAINLSATDSNDGDTWSFSADALPAGASFVDNADGSARFNWIPGYTQQGTYTVTFTVTDNGLPALSHSETITIIVNDINRSPYLYPIGNKTVDDGVLLSFQLRATDADGNGLSFTSTALPAGATLVDNTNGTASFNWTPTASQVGTSYPITFTVTDNGLPAPQSDSESINILVTTPDIVPPVVTAPASIIVPAVNAAGAPSSHPLITAFLSGASAQDDIDGVITNITNNGPVQYLLDISTTVVFSATDSSNNTGTASATVTVSDLSQPVITLLGSNPLSINEGTVFSDPGSTVSDNVDTGLVATVTGSVNANVAGSYTLNYNVSDSAGNAATQVSRTVNVRDITRPVISLTGQASITLNINAAYSDQGATASDNVDGNLTTSIIMSGSVDTTTPGVYILTYNVSDSAGNAAIAVTRSVTVQDAAAPVVSPPASITVAATDATGTAATDAAIMAFLNGASAIDDVDTTLTISNNAPVQFPLGVTSVVFSATDSANNIGSASAAVTVSDLTRPVITLLGSNPLSINEGTVFSDPGTTVSDNVDTGLVATVTGSVNNSIVGIYTLNYNVVDAAGNAAITQTREVHVVAAVDTTPPVIDLLGVNPVSIEQGMLYDDAGATASDNVDTTITVITSGTVNTSVVGSYTLSYNATDSSGNAASTVTRIVHVTLDATSPTISLLGNNPESVEQGSLYLDAGATANDNFDGDITADIVVNNSVDTSRVGNYTVTYNVSDAAGNQALQATRTVHVTAPPVQNQAPVVIAPVDIVVAATGSVTSVNLGQAQVSDDHDTALVASANNPGPFKPGRYEIVWSATDSGNLTDTAVQVLEVQPIAEFMPDQYVESGHSVNVRVALNGQAAVYPVTIYYDVTTNGISIPGAAGSLAITQGSVGVINYTVPWHIQTGDITFNMTAATNAVIGAQSSHVISIISDNMEPLPLIEVTQNGKLTRIVTTDGGAVTVKAIVSDSNAADSHSYDWSKTDNVLLATSPGANDAQFLIDPASLTEQFYKIGVKVTDSGVPALDGEFELYIKVLSTAPVLSASDSDGDGVNDDVEGIADDDQDGIPNYIDGVNIISLLQGRVGDSNKWLINVQSGLGIRLGQFSLLAGQHNANISAQDIQNRAGSIPAAIANATDDHNNVGGYFDFEITGLSRAGQSVQLVIPLYAVIPENAVYRKYSELNGWSNFVENNHNKLYSAPGQAGVCPAPGSSDYTEGLAPGSYCVQLLIEDGGPNDSDAKRNGSIADPGGIGVKNTTPASTPGSGGGGSVLPVPLLLLLILYVMGLVIRAVNTWPLKKLKLYRCI